MLFRSDRKYINSEITVFVYWSVNDKRSSLGASGRAPYDIKRIPWCLEDHIVTVNDNVSKRLRALYTRLAISKLSPRARLPPLFLPPSFFSSISAPRYIKGLERLPIRIPGISIELPSDGNRLRVHIYARESLWSQVFLWRFGFF